MAKRFFFCKVFFRISIVYTLSSFVYLVNIAVHNLSLITNFKLQRMTVETLALILSRQTLSFALMKFFNSIHIMFIIV